MCFTPAGFGHQISVCRQCILGAFTPAFDYSDLDIIQILQTHEMTRQRLGISKNVQLSGQELFLMDKSLHPPLQSNSQLGTMAHHVQNDIRCLMQKQMFLQVIKHKSHFNIIIAIVMQFILIELLVEIILTPRLRNDMTHTGYPALLILFAEGVRISVLSLLL